MGPTKDRVIATVRAAINTPAPRLISFRHLFIFKDDETRQAFYEFEVNGVPLKTELFETDYYRFLDENIPHTSSLSIQELKLLLWWMERPDTKIIKHAQEPLHYLD